MLDAVIFDMDGLLIDTASGVGAADLELNSLAEFSTGHLEELSRM